jgi:hypothetical protein
MLDIGLFRVDKNIKGVGSHLMMTVSQLGGAAKMMMDQRLAKCRLTAISFTTKII